MSEVKKLRKRPVYCLRGKVVKEENSQIERESHCGGEQLD